MAKPSLPSISIVLIMYNERGNIGAALDETLCFCKDSLDDWEIVVVDDGSTDSSAVVVEPYAEADSRIRLVRHPMNLGMGAAIRTGIQNAQKEYFVFNATDGQIAAAEIGRLIPLLECADIALSTYSNRRETLGREVLSRAFRVYLRAVAGIKFELQGLYLFPTAVAREVADSIRANTFFFNFELVQRGLDRGLKAASTKITCRPRRSGVSRVATPRRIVRVAKDALIYGLGRRTSS